MMSLTKEARSKFSKNKHKLNTIQAPQNLGLLVLTKPTLVSSTQYFIEARGYSVKQSIHFQICQDTMQLEVKLLLEFYTNQNISNADISSSATKQ
jgi:hypothetical protein